MNSEPSLAFPVPDAHPRPGPVFAQNAGSIWAETPAPDMHWLLPSSASLLFETPSPTGPARSQSSAPHALWLAANGPRSIRSLVPVALFQSASLSSGPDRHLPSRAPTSAGTDWLCRYTLPAAAHTVSGSPIAPACSVRLSQTPPVARTTGWSHRR